MGVVVGVGRIPLEEDLVFAVTVHVADRAVVGAVGGYLAVGHDAVGRDRQRDGDVAGGSACGQQEAARLALAGGRPDLVGGRRGGSVAVDEEGHVRDRFVVDLHAVTVDVELDVRRILGQVAPGHEHLRGALAHGNHAAAEVLHLQPAEIIGRLGRRRERAQAEEQKGKDLVFHIVLTVIGNRTRLSSGDLRRRT